MEKTADTMEHPSATAHRGRIRWQGFLLAVSLLTLWSPPTTAQLVLELMPSNAAEWEDVLFLVYNQTDDRIGYAWFKGQTLDRKHQIASYNLGSQSTATGPAYSGRETIYPNGSLLVQNVTLEDTGYYILQTLNSELQGEIVTGQLRVYQKTSTGSSQQNVAGIVIGVLVGVVLAAALGCFLFLRKTRRASGLHDPGEHWPPASTPGHGFSSTSASPVSPSPPRPFTQCPGCTDSGQEDYSIPQHSTRQGEPRPGQEEALLQEQDHPSLS
ncbi:cell adhesion molecule CEACAM3 isoform X2 [Rhinolophus sinicus]|uniref:cell adhesion molecule CEACAM3 isoform X2 n=1 Tax=Rhinolophus sinicus TaxID=89399 RepID=UPI003D7971AC